VAEPLKAFRVTTTCTGEGPIVQTVWAKTRSAARMEVARQIVDAGWYDRVRDVLGLISVKREAARDEPARTLDPRLTDRQRELMEHAVGNWTGRPGTEPGRNYFCCHVDDADFVVLEALGWMNRGRLINEGRDVYYRVTEAGFRALGLPVPAEVSHA
jgi:hypothetical protein